MLSKEQQKITSAVKKYLRDPEIPEAVRNGRELAYDYLWGTGNQLLKDYLKTGQAEALVGAFDCLEAAKLDFGRNGSRVMRSLYAMILSDLGITLAEMGKREMAKENFVEALAVAIDGRYTDLAQSIRENLALLEKRSK